MAILFLIGRIILGGFFIYQAYGHFRNRVGLAEYAKMKRVPMPKAAVIGTGVLMAIGGISIILGFYMVLGMIILVLCLLPITIMMHNFWKDIDPQIRMNNRINFFKNVAIIGALVMLIAIGMLLASVSM